jgi:hypothetical protein
MIRQLVTPPRSPKDCVFALTTQTLSADLKTKIVPCQFGGNPDCGSCGCVASMGLPAVAAHKLGGIIPVGAIFKASIRIGQAWSKRTTHTPPRITHYSQALIVPALAGKADDCGPSITRKAAR